MVCRQSTREELPEVAERCREMVANTPFDIGLEKPINITCSIGFSLLPPDKEEDFDTAWKRNICQPLSITRCMPPNYQGEMDGLA